MGLRPEGTNPCRGIRRYRRKGRERFLSDEELRRLSARLSAHADEYPGQVAVIRLLLLTGCRKGEILTLRRSDYREGHLFLRDSKTGPRTVWLSGPARKVLDSLDRTGVWMFPSSRKGGHCSACWVDLFWRRVDDELLPTSTPSRQSRTAREPPGHAPSPSIPPDARGRQEEREASGRSNGMGRRKPRPGHHPSSETRP